MGIDGRKVDRLHPSYCGWGLAPSYLAVEPKLLEIEGKCRMEQPMGRPLSNFVDEVLHIPNSIGQLHEVLLYELKDYPFDFLEFSRLLQYIVHTDVHGGQ